jgi:hypothetical protein
VELIVQRRTGGLQEQGEGQMSIEGTYGFVYSGLNGLGVGIFTVTGESFEGVDFVGGRYAGTARENSNSTISISIDFDVKPGMVLVQGTAPQDVPHRRHIEHEMPAGFGNGQPIQIGSVTMMVKRVPDDWAKALYEGLFVSIGPKRLNLSEDAGAKRDEATAEVLRKP